VRRGAGLIAGLALLAAPGGAPRPARFLYVWAGTGHEHGGTGFIAVLDANPASPGYGRIVGAAQVTDHAVMPHHTEYALPADGRFFANDYTTGQSYLIDGGSPGVPRVAGRLDSVPGFRLPHSFARLTDSRVLATMQFGDSSRPGDPGGLAEFDASGRLLRSGSSADSAFPGARIRTYGLELLPAIDRVLTTSSPMDPEATANVVQVWRLSDLRLLRTIPVPGVPGDSVNAYPFEVRVLADGRTLFLNTYNCGFYRITGLETEAPKVELVLAMPHPRRIGCSVPVVLGRYWVMPIAYAHVIVTLDLADPLNPKEVSALPTDSTFVPHWLAADPGSDRLVVTGQSDGEPRVLMARLDRSTGRLSWDERFRERDSTRIGVSFNRADWPGGAIHGMAMPHGALFVP
jgi:hypothetical protein